jgi:uncharacterized membrane protein
MKYSVHWGLVAKKVWTQFLAGILVIIPLAVTVLILAWIFNYVDNILQPVLTSIIGRHIPGVGFVVTIVLIYVAGVIASSVLGKRLIIFGESLLRGIPLVRELYNGIKQILESFSAPGKTGFMNVVLVEFPRKGMRTIGFITNETVDRSGKKLINIFIPTAPNPTSGFLQIAEESEIIRTGISVENAIKMVVSAGRIVPDEINKKLPVDI